MQRAEEVCQISAEATQDAVTEVRLVKLAEDFGRLEVPVQALGDSTDVFILGDLADVRAGLEDCLTTVHTVLSFRCAAGLVCAQNVPRPSNISRLIELQELVGISHFCWAGCGPIHQTRRLFAVDLWRSRSHGCCRPARNSRARQHRLTQRRCLWQAAGAASPGCRGPGSQDPGRCQLPGAVAPVPAPVAVPGQPVHLPGTPAAVCPLA